MREGRGVIVGSYNNYMHIDPAVPAPLALEKVIRLPD